MDKRKELYEDAINYYKSYDYLPALYIFEELANEKNINATYMLGIMHYRGLGVLKNDKRALKYFEDVATDGHMLSQYNTGYLYYHGIGTKMNHKESVKWFEMSGLQGHLESQQLLGSIYFRNALEDAYEEMSGIQNEYGLDDDIHNKYYEEYGHYPNQYTDEFGQQCYTEKYLEESEKQSIIDDMFFEHSNEIIRMYAEGNGVEQNLHEALRWFLMYTNIKPNSRIYETIGQMYEYGNGVKCNIDEANKWYKLANAVEDDFDESPFSDDIKVDPDTSYDNDNEALKCYFNLAKIGDKNAEFNIGYYYFNEYDMTSFDDKEGKKKAFAWFNLAADKGQMDAMYYLAMMYETGLGIQEDLDKAFAIYLELANGGYIEAFYKLGRLYENGLGTFKDIQNAKKWYKEAAKHDDENAEDALGMIDFELIGDDEYEPFDKEKNMQERLQSADGGDVEELYQMGKLLFEGKEIKMNREKAIGMFYQAASKGHSGAQFELGFIFSNAKTVLKDFPVAYVFYILAGAEEKSKNLYSLMSKNERTISEDLLRDEESFFELVKPKCITSLSSHPIS
jgi:hypothetical protein